MMKKREPVIILDRDFAAFIIMIGVILLSCAIAVSIHDFYLYLAFTFTMFIIFFAVNRRDM